MDDGAAAQTERESRRAMLRESQTAKAAGLAVAGGVLAWLTISSEVLESEPAPGGDLSTGVLHDFSCAVAGPPLRPGREAECHPIAADSAPG